MQPKPMAFRRVLFVLACLAFFALPAGAQQIPSPQGAIPPRITQPVDEANLVTLKGNTHPLARPEFDLGPAPANLPLNRMLLVLSRSPEQEAALETLLDQQQDKSSPNYHNWLTPEQFGRQFGPADQDVQTVTSWLETHGFAVSRVSKGRVVIEFSGTASQLRAAFHTEIHKYAVNGEEHWANATDPQIPTALAPVVAGLKTLHNFYKKPQILITGEKFTEKVKPGLPPEFTSSTGLHALAPGDYATIYNINPLYSAGINGTGTTIAVVGRSDFILQDVIDFRNMFGMPSNMLAEVFNGPDPGILNTGEQFEATLDTTWSGAVAPNAEIIFVVSASTNTTDGLDLSEEYIIDNDLGNVMTESFSGCEEGATSADASSISSLAEQAAAEGITYMVSTGDSGAEGCDNPDTETRASSPVSVNILASSPYTLGVGGTLFVEGANAAKYWNSTNSGGQSSALSYIPENVWNESCTAGCGQNGSGSIWAGGGGESTLFKKPSWQSGIIPTDTFRDLPDVSLTAAGHDPYLLCFEYSCEQGEFYGVSGTSASAPSFAGIMALVNQKTGSKQGQANYVLYRLAAQETLASCNASSATAPPASTCIFNDVTVGNNAVPGEVGYGTPTAEYQSTVGYDRATGLGSVNVANLVNGWGTARSVVSATTLSITPSTNVTHGTPLDVTISVAPTPPATGSPTGDVALIGDFSTVSSISGETEVAQLTLSNSTASSASVNQLPGGTYNLQAHYEGDATFVPSDSTAVKVDILPEPITETASAVTGTPPNLTSFTTQTYGALIYVQAKVTGKSGVGAPTGTITFTDSVQGSLGSATLDQTGTATTSDVAQVVNGGSHTVTARYSGDASFQSGTSSVTFSLTPDPTTTVIQPPTAPIIEGGPPQVLVNVTAVSSGQWPTGSVTAFVGTTQLGGVVPISGSTSGSGTLGVTAEVPLTGLPPGSATITVKYSGDSNYQPSTSAPLTVNIVRSTTLTITSSPTTSQAGQSVTFTANVAPGQSGPAMTGTVQFMLNQTPLGNAVAIQNGQAQFTTNSLPWGSDVIFAFYSGDSNYGPSSDGMFEIVNPLTATVALVTSNASAQQGQNVTFTATVTPTQQGGPAPTGGVQFQLSGSTYFTGVLNASGQTAYSTNTLSVGTYTVGAVYNGDTKYSGSSATLTETVTVAPTLLITANTPTVTVVSPGQSGSTMLTFTGQNGLTGSATLTSAMCSHLPSESTCSFSPSTINLTAQITSQTVTLTVMTTAPSSAAPFARRFIPGAWRGTVQVALACVFCFSLLLSSRARQRRWNFVLACVVFVAVATFPSCGGGGGSSGPPPPPPNLGTPVGNYTGVTVTVTMGGVTQSINTIAVNVE